MNKVEVKKNEFFASCRLKRTPCKLSMIVPLIKGLKAKDALIQLQFCRKAAAQELYTILRSAVANADYRLNVLEGGDIDTGEFIVDNVLLGPSLKLKRLYERARGRANFKFKRYSECKIIIKG